MQESKGIVIINLFFIAMAIFSGCQKKSQEQKIRTPIVINPHEENLGLEAEIQKLTNLIAQTPKDSPVRKRLHFAMGETYVKYGKVEDAITCFEKSSGMEALEAKRCYYLGMLYSQKGRDDLAGKYWQRHLALNPDSPKREEIAEKTGKNRHYEN